MPEGVVNFCPGAGASFGDAVVAHPKTRYIAFTGSREVGLHINKVAATQAPGQIWIKRTILEMGGKDAIIVDADADIDSAVEGVAQAAFGFQGQKCSACSRAIVDERIYDKFLEQLKARVEKIQVGDSPRTPNMGAVINEGSMKTILEYIEQGKKDGRLITGGERAEEPGEGYFIQPTVIADIPAEVEARAGRNLRPVLAVIKARGFDHALEIANDTEFGLTGAVYTKFARQDRSRHPRVPRRQPVHQPQVHRSDGRRASLRRIQHVGHRLEIRRPRLSCICLRRRSRWARRLSNVCLV